MIDQCFLDFLSCFVRVCCSVQPSANDFLAESQDAAGESRDRFRGATHKGQSPISQGDDLASSFGHLRPANPGAHQQHHTADSRDGGRPPFCDAGTDSHTVLGGGGGGSSIRSVFSASKSPPPPPPPPPPPCRT
ncbi:hypothetical protein CDEST_14777 [Colletotrichum destructivum]|uniref:Uncharacterized protein n=1 Tax=Colletotrichum destructivum TaxID=34406 RepID=A0AAX4J307_9PEZI|nr:hypothetical protein CDEST_14777 [Colletotrichum destructivum]